jgi:hypothetical protein
MRRRLGTISCLLSVLCVGVGCNKSSDTPASTTTSGSGATSPDKSAVASTPASGAAASAAGSQAGGAANVGASATDKSAAPIEPPATAATPSSAPASVAGGPASGASTAPAAAESPEAMRKRVEIEWALKQDEIKNDPNGQWAAQAKASSTLKDAQGDAPFSPSQVTGAPNIEGYGNNGSAWTPKTPDAGIEWLDVQYRKPVHATAVRVRESYGSGVVMKIELFDEQGAAHTVWTGADPTKDLNYLIAEFPKTAFKTGRVKLTLATNVVGGLNEIDAVQLVGTEQ